MGLPENVVCCVSLIRSVGWTNTAAPVDQQLLESLINMYNVWERTCFLHGGIRKEFSDVRPARLRARANLNCN